MHDVSYGVASPGTGSTSTKRRSAARGPPAAAQLLFRAMPSAGRDLPPGDYLRLRDEPDGNSAAFRIHGDPLGLEPTLLDEITAATRSAPTERRRNRTFQAWGCHA